MSAELKPLLERFAAKMEETLDKHDPDKGSSWRNDFDPDECLNRLSEEVEELQDALRLYQLYKTVMKDTDLDIVERVKCEAVDVANFAFFVFENIRNGRW